MTPDELDCRSETGVIVGLLDGMIAQARVVGAYIRSHAIVEQKIVEALADLRSDEDVASVIGRS